MGNLRLRVILMASGVALSWMWTSGDFLWASEDSPLSLAFELVFQIQISDEPMEVIRMKLQ